MELSDLFVSHKQVDPVSFDVDTPDLPKNIYLNLERAQKAASGETENTSNWVVGNSDGDTYNWKVGTITSNKPTVPNNTNSDYFTNLRNFIIEHEGFRDKAYQDGKYYSIGYGFNDPKYKAGDTMTREEADKELDRQLRTREEKYLNRFGSKWSNLTDNQKIALMSYGYNTGDGNIIGGNVAKYLDAGDMKNLRDSISINTAGGVYNSGLDARRKKERTLFDT